MAAARPRERPSFEERTDGADAPRVTVGLFVKVGCCSERFWCRVTSVSADGEFVACVDNDLVVQHNPYRSGDQLVLHTCNVLETADLRECVRFRELAATLGPMSGALAWQAARESEGVAARDEVHTYYMVGRHAVAQSDVTA